MSLSSVKLFSNCTDGTTDAFFDEKRNKIIENSRPNSRRSSTDTKHGEMRSITEYRYNEIGEVIEIVQSFRLEKKRVPSKSITQKSEDGEEKVRLNPQDISAHRGQDRTNMKRGRKSNKNKPEQIFGMRIRNLSPSTTNYDVENLVKSCGLISKIYVARDNVTGDCRGFAFVDFKNRADASAAIEKLNGYGYEHKFLKADWARKKFNDDNEKLSYPSH